MFFNSAAATKTFAGVCINRESPLFRCNNLNGIRTREAGCSHASGEMIEHTAHDIPGASRLTHNYYGGVLANNTPTKTSKKKTLNIHIIMYITHCLRTPSWLAERVRKKTNHHQPSASLASSSSRRLHILSHELHTHWCAYVCMLRWPAEAQKRREGRRTQPLSSFTLSVWPDRREGPDAGCMGGGTKKNCASLSSIEAIHGRGVIVI